MQFNRFVIRKKGEVISIQELITWWVSPEGVDRWNTLEEAEVVYQDMKKADQGLYQIDQITIMSKFNVDWEQYL